MSRHPSYGKATTGAKKKNEKITRAVQAKQAAEKITRAVQAKQAGEKITRAVLGCAFRSLAAQVQWFS